MVDKRLVIALLVAVMVTPALAAYPDSIESSSDLRVSINAWTGSVADYVDLLSYGCGHPIDKTTGSPIANITTRFGAGSLSLFGIPYNEYSCHVRQRIGKSSIMVWKAWYVRIPAGASVLPQNQVAGVCQKGETCPWFNTWGVKANTGDKLAFELP